MERTWDRAVPDRTRVADCTWRGVALHDCPVQAARCSCRCPGGRRLSSLHAAAGARRAWPGGLARIGLRAAAGRAHPHPWPALFCGHAGACGSATCIMPLPRADRAPSSAARRLRIELSARRSGSRPDRRKRQAVHRIQRPDRRCSFGCSTRFSCRPFMAPCSAADFAREDGVHLASLQAALGGKPYTRWHSRGTARSCTAAARAARSMAAA